MIIQKTIFFIQEYRKLAIFSYSVEQNCYINITNYNGYTLIDHFGEKIKIFVTEKSKVEIERLPIDVLLNTHLYLNTRIDNTFVTESFSKIIDSMFIEISYKNIMYYYINDNYDFDDVKVLYELLPFKNKKMEVLTSRIQIMFNKTKFFINFVQIKDSLILFKNKNLC